MKTRGQKVLINTLTLGIYQVVYFICGLILPRYILTYFGSTYNGVVSSITRFLGFISILNVGIAGPTRVALYKVLADNDKNGISGIVNATERYMRKVGFVLLLYIGLMVFVYPVLANTTIPNYEIALLVLILGAQTFATYFFGVTYQILLIADQRQYVHNLVNTIATILNVVIAVVLIKSGCNIFMVKLGSMVVFVLSPITLALYVRRRYQIDKKAPQDKTALKGRWDAMWHSLANIVHNGVSSVALTIFVDVKLLSVYSVYYLVINGLYQVLTIFTSSLEAAFGNMLAKNELKSASKNLETYEYFVYTFVSLIFSCGLVLIVPFVKVYTAGITDVNYNMPTFACIAVVAQMIMCIRQPYLSIVQAAGHYKQTRNGALVEASLNVLITFALTPVLGLVGAALGMFFANTFRTIQYMFYLRKNIIFRPIREPLGMLLWATANTLVVVLICQCVLSFMAMTSWMGWIFAGVICFAISFAVNLISSLLFCREKLLTFICAFKNIVLKRKNG